MNVEIRLASFKKAAFENALRLFEDACILFGQGRFPSALALAVTSFEELGKLHVIDRGCDSICLNPEAFDEIYEMYFSGPWLTDHLHKQRRALFDALGLDSNSSGSLHAWIDSGGLESQRQMALYAAMTRKSVESPNRISDAMAKRILEMCYAALVESAELAFNGFGAAPTSKSEWLAATAICQAGKARARFHDA